MNKTNLVVGALIAVAITASAAENGASGELVAAAKALAGKPNYSWKTTTQVPEGTQFQPGPIDGKANKEGLIMVSQSFGPGTMEIVKQGEKAAITNQDGGWDSLADAEQEEGFGRFRAIMARNLMAPGEDAADLAGHLKEIKVEDGVYSGELTEDGAKSMMGFGGRTRGDDNAFGPAISSASGSAKFWVKDGVLNKMEIKVDGSMDFNGNEIEIVRTVTTEIKDIGSTTIDIPAAAKEKLK